MTERKFKPRGQLLETMRLLAHNPYLTTAQLADALGISHEHVRIVLKSGRDHGVLKKHVWYEVVEKLQHPDGSVVRRASMPHQRMGSPAWWRTRLEEEMEGIRINDWIDWGIYLKSLVKKIHAELPNRPASAPAIMDMPIIDSINVDGIFYPVVRAAK